MMDMLTLITELAHQPNTHVEATTERTGSVRYCASCAPQSAALTDFLLTEEAVVTVTPNDSAPLMAICCRCSSFIRKAKP